MSTIKATKVSQEVTGQTFIFGKTNYMVMILGLLLIIVGFILMNGGGSDDPNVFSEALFSTRRLTIAPIMVIAGYVVEVYAIMMKPSADKVVNE